MSSLLFSDPPLGPFVFRLGLLVTNYMTYPSSENVLIYPFLKKDFIYLFLERGEGRKGEKHQCVVASHMLPTGDLACNPGTCPDWELNRPPFASQTHAQSTEPQQSGLSFNS